MKFALKTMLAIIGIIALNAAGKHLPALQMAEQTLARNKNGLLAFTIPVAALGFMLFTVGILIMLYEKGTPMSHTEVEEQHRTAQNMRAAPYMSRWSTYRIYGKTKGWQFHEELPIRDFKLAWQSGAWRQDTIWRARFTVFAGALMAIFGGLATAAVVSPIAWSLICAAFLIYSAVRLIWALWRA
jgi:hypothetical protein